MSYIKDCHKYFDKKPFFSIVFDVFFDWVSVIVGI